MSTALTLAVFSCLLLSHSALAEPSVPQVAGSDCVHTEAGDHCTRGDADQHQPDYVLAPEAWQVQRKGVRPVYYVRALGKVDARHTEYACRAIKSFFRMDCRVLRPRAMPEVAYSLRRNQYDADKLIDLLFEQLPDDALGLVSITNADLFGSGSQHGHFVFGLASMVDHVGVVSLARYRGAWYGEARDALTEHRTFEDLYYKVLIHEVAHTLGVGHCDNTACAMREDRTLDDLMDSPRGVCQRHRKAIRDGIRRIPGTAGWHYMRGHSHLGRSQLPQAVYHFRQAVELLPEDARFQNDLGVALLRRGDQARALYRFRQAGRLDPAFPNPLFNEALIFASVQDHNRERHALELALSINPGWAQAHKRLSVLCSEHLQDAECAEQHRSMYLAAEGVDPSLVDRGRVVRGGGAERPGQ